MINRRTSLGLIAGTLFAASCQKAQSQKPKTQSKPLSLNPSNPEDLHYMHRKLAYALDDRLTYWNIEALRMGFRNGVLTPFWKLHAGIIYRSKTLDDFRYSNEAILKIYYTDLETGELLERFDNPYTGKTVEAVQPKLFKTKRVFGLKGIEHDTPTSTAGVYKFDDIGPARIIGNDIWLNADSILRSEPPNPQNRLVQVTDWSTYHGHLDDLTNPDLKSAAATHTFNDLNTFNHSWIGMDDVKEAWSISRGFGRKSDSPDGLPEIWKKFAADTNPELLSDDPGFE